jgi:quinoprotein dehydrogenase-associated probable ABC transporter substrate-binding protein
MRNAAMAWRFFLAAAFVAGLSSELRAEDAAPQDKVSHTDLRVCADPSNLPYSNDKQEGFENKIAALLAKDLGETASFTWYPDSSGFLRATLYKHRCDVIVGTVAGNDELETSTPYYESGYVLVSRTANNFNATSVGDPALQGSRFGLIAKTPPTDLLLKHNLLGRTHFYELVVDTRVEQPAHQMLLDLVDKKIDVGLLWGPFAGYYIKHDNLPLKAVPVDAEGAKFLRLKIAMGVRPSDHAFLHRLNDAITKDQASINAILDDYGIPRTK